MAAAAAVAVKMQPTGAGGQGGRMNAIYVIPFASIGKGRRSIGGAMRGPAIFRSLRVGFFNADFSLIVGNIPRVEGREGSFTHKGWRARLLPAALYDCSSLAVINPLARSLTRTPRNDSTTYSSLPSAILPFFPISPLVLSVGLDRDGRNVQIVIKCATSKQRRKWSKR